MPKFILIASAITVALFLIGIVLMAFTKSFSEYWLTGVGIVGLAIIVIVISLVVKLRS